MKRKRGNKKGKAKRTPDEFVNETTHNAISVNTEDDSGMDEGNDELDSGMEVETPSSGGTGNGLPEKLEANNSDKLVEKAKGNLVYGRVKVKIKNKKTLDSHHASSDAPTQSDTDKSSPQVDMERLGVVCEKMEDSANSLLDYGNSSKKSGSIKIKSSRMLGSTSLNGCSTKTQLLVDKTYKKEPEHLLPDAQPNRQELQASLEVIKKIMKMDAAEPFNAPVNPVALGIPDYFQVIDTPMDFGTICNNLESGIKYKNSEDVFKDVRLVWENCYKYNNKGDYVVELMKRVKKNLMKYWTAAGLLTETSQGTSGAESMQGNDTSTPSNAKFTGKSGSAKHKNKKRHGVKKHKDDCLCAICVMMRRRQEREESNQPSEDRMESISSRQVKLEETTAAESQYSGDTSSNMDNSEGPDADAELEEKGEEVKLPVGTSEKQSPMQEKENEMTIELKENDEIIEQSEPNEQSTQEHERDYPMREVQSGRNNRTDGRKEEISLRQEGEAEKEKSKTTTEEEKQKDKMYESLSRLENPMLLELCGALFPNNNDDKSAWRGPHSLVGSQGSARRRSSIHEAIAIFLN